MVEVTPAGREALRARTQVTLTRPAAPAASTASGPAALPCDEALLDTLRRLRKELADAADVPAFVIFSDVSLRQMAREYPADARAFRRINGVGDRKLAELGPRFLRAIADHVATHGKQHLEATAAPAPAISAKPLNDTGKETLRRQREGASVEVIAAARGLAASTIWSHLATAVEAGESVDVDAMLPREQQERVAALFAELGTGNLTGVIERLGGELSYGQVRLLRAAREARPARADQETRPRATADDEAAPS